jgi:hypothetical protein
MDTGEVLDEVDQDEIEERNVSAEKKHRDDDYERRIGQFLVTPDSLVLRLPWPRTFLQLGPDFAEEGFRFREHGEKLNS